MVKSESDRDKYIYPRRCRLPVADFEDKIFIVTKFESHFSYQLI